MVALSFQQIIDSIEQLSLEQQNSLFELIRKRRIEKQRGEIADNAESTFKSLKNGIAKKGNIYDLREDLLDDSN